MSNEAEIFSHIFQLTRDFERNFRDQGAENLSTTQFQALNILKDGAPVTAMDMAGRLEVAGPTATRTIDSLARRRFVVKDRDPQDRRIVWLRLTESGQMALEHETIRQIAWVERLLANLTPLEHQALLALLAKILPGMSS